MLPLKINTDLDPTIVPENSSTLNVNVNIDILKGVVTNEQGFEIIPLTSVTKKIVGSCRLSDNSLCLFSQVLYPPLSPKTYLSEIGILSTDNVYSVVLRDNTTVGALLNFNTENLIQASTKVNFNGDQIVYWVDGDNSDKWLNLTNPQVELTTELRLLDKSQLNLMRSFTPTIGEYPNLTVISGGQLETGVYYVAITYGDKYKNFTKTNIISNPIPITNSTPPFDNQYIGSEPGVTSNKAISVNIASAEVNREYSFIKVEVISKINQTLKAYEFATFEIPTGDFSCVIDTLINKVETTADAIIINNANYKSALTLTQLDDVLYKAHLRERETIDLQPYVNNIKVNYTQKEIDLSSPVASKSFRDPDMTFYSKGFTYDEVYALYASFTIDDDGEYESQAYHIPGRLPTDVRLLNAGPFVPEDISLNSVASATYMSTQYYVDGTVSDVSPVAEILKINSADSKVFHAVPTYDNSLADTNMAYWENKDEVYSDENKWITLNSGGSVVSGKDFRGQKVRHHKFPEAYNCAITPNSSNEIVPDLLKSIHPDNASYNIVNLLGVQLSNIVLPTSISSKVKKINLYYAKRDLNNRTILGQTLLQSLSQPHNAVETTYLTSNTAWNNGGQFVITTLPQDSGPTGRRPFGLFPVGYEKTTIQDTNEWMYCDVIIPRTSPDFWGKGYYKFKAFDLMQQKLDVGSSVYIKNLYRVKSLYKVGVAEGTDLNNITRNFILQFLFDPAKATNTTGIRADYYGSIDRQVNEVESLGNSIRLITNKGYVAQGFPNQRNSVTSSPYSYPAIPFNFGGQLGVWVETDSYLKSHKLNAGNNDSGNDFSYISGESNTLFFRANTVPEKTLYVSPYISNLCTFKLNIYQSFEDQVLCLADSINIADIATTEIYGGDTFTSIVSDRDGVDVSAYSPQGNPVAADPNARPLGLFRGIHCYIAQSTSNPNYRYEGDNSWETFYPYTSIQEMWSLAQTDPEWFGYNIDYSSVNDLRQPLIASNYSNQIQDYFPNRVIRSAKDNPELEQDNYLDFQAGDYDDFGKIKGKIRNITNQNNKLLIKTDNALYVTLGRETISTEGAEANITSGDIFAVKPKEIVSSDSYGGGMGRFADIVTQYGYIYPDTTNGIVYNFNGENVDEISKFGRQIFFRNELKFKLPNLLNSYVYNSFPLYVSSTTYVKNYNVKFNGKVYLSLNAGILGTPGESNDWIEQSYKFERIDSVIDIQSIGVQAVFDYKYRRYILTKKDYTLGVGNNIAGFIGVIPADLDATPIIEGYTKAWWNGYIYTLYVDTIPDFAVERLVTRGSDIVYGAKINFENTLTKEYFTTAYYPEIQSWASMYDFGGLPEFSTYTLDKVYSFNSNTLFQHNSNLQNSLFYNRTVPYASFVEPILNTPAGTKRFSSFSILTKVFKKNGVVDYLKTFTSYFVRNSYQISKKLNFLNTQTSRNSEGYFNANDFRDLTRDNNLPLLTGTIITQPNAANINVNKHWSKQKKFVDYYLIPRLEFNQNWEQSTTLLIGNINYTFDGILENNTIIKFTYLSQVYVYQITNVILDEINNVTVVELVNIRSLNNTAILSVGLIDPSIEISSFEYIFQRELNLFDVSTLTHKNTR